MIEEYIEQHIDSEPDYLKALFRDANRKLLYPRMMSGHLQGRLLKMFMEMIRPERVLEVGTFAAYTTLCLAEGISSEAIIDTIEVNDELETFIREHLDRSTLGSKIRLHIGDVLEVVPALSKGEPTWDAIYIDADKRMYPDYYKLLLPVLKEGGWIIADNTLWNGRVVENLSEIRHDNKNKQLEGIICFNDMIAADSAVEKVILPVRDGMTIIRKKPLWHKE